jgi:hypothetical protein
MRSTGAGTAVAFRPITFAVDAIVALWLLRRRGEFRGFEQATHDDVAPRYLSANQHTDHDTATAFRQQHVEPLSGLFVQALRLRQKAGSVRLGNVAIDGTKIICQRHPSFGAVPEADGAGAAQGRTGRIRFRPPQTDPMKVRSHQLGRRRPCSGCAARVGSTWSDVSTTITRAYGCSV